MNASRSMGRYYMYKISTSPKGFFFTFLNDCAKITFSPSYNTVDFEQLKYINILLFFIKQNIL